jgi:hypothetical protein
VQEARTEAQAGRDTRLVAHAPAQRLQLGGVAGRHLDVGQHGEVVAVAQAREVRAQHVGELRVLPEALR